MAAVQLILASTSPRRAELLRAAGFTFSTYRVDVDETPHRDELPGPYVRRLAQDKSAKAIQMLRDGPAEAGHYRSQAAAVGQHRGQALQPGDDRNGQRNQGSVGNIDQGPIVLAADTAVVIDGEILGKPRDDHETARMLRRLSGRRHEVLTGVSVRRGEHELGRVESTAVYFADLGNEDVAWYVKSGEGRDKAGAYAIQGLASRFVPRIEGSYSNVVGLPISVVYELLSAMEAS